MKAGLASAIIPGICIVSGAYLVHLGIAGSLAIWNLSLFTGMGIAWSPLLKHRQIESQHEKEIDASDTLKNSFTQPELITAAASS